MNWIKRNLSLVVSGAIALGLLGFGGFYLFSAIKKNEDIDQQIGQTKSEIERLLNSDPTPNQQNVKLARDEAAKLTAFIAEARKQFPATPAPAEPLNDLSFRSLLANTVSDLHHRATSVGIKVGDRGVGEDESYYFTFGSQRNAMRFPPESLRPLSERLHEVRQMAEILFASKVNRLVTMKRAKVPGEVPQTANQSGGAAVVDHLNVGARTNAETSMVLWPYEVVFDCFSPELGTVVEALERTPGFIVKSVVTDISPEAVAAAQRRPPPTNQPPLNSPQRLPPGGGAATPAPGAVRPNVPAPAPTLETVINERPLRVTLRIEVIKPEPMQPGTGGPTGGPGGRRGGPRPNNP